MQSSSLIVGHNTHRYKVINGWGNLDSSLYPVNDCHEMVIDSKKRVILLTNETKNNILIYNNDGKLLDSWGHDYPGGHGLSIHNENGEEFLYICDYTRHRVLKTTLTGKLIMIIDYPKETGKYESAEQFNPTETSIASNGDIYVTDGYGLQYVIQFSSKGEYIRHWGGKGDNDEQFDVVHGIVLDTRKGNETTLLITSRNHSAFKRFTLEGEYIETISLPGSFICRPVIKGKFIYAAVFRSESNMNYGSGYITILNETNRVISTPGATEPIYVNNKLQPQIQQSKMFIHPHDVCIDDDENIYVCQWKADKTYPIKLERV